jgi:hyperosmotically inducible protein
MNHRILHATQRNTWAATAMLAALLALPAATQAASSMPDALITTKIKIALLTTEGVSSTAVNVDTINGHVTLQGKVETPDEKNKAEAAAKQVTGVREVRNLLQIVPAEQQPAVQRADDEIKTNIEKALEARQFRDKTHIAVQSVNQGVVVLSGNAASVTDHLSAIETAARQPGVRRVASEITSPDMVAEVERPRAGKANANAKPASEYGVADAARDSWITSATKMRLLADRRTPALEVNVDTRDGIVTLFGMVPSTAAKTAAASDAHKVSGVKQVVNELQVVPEAEQKIVKAKDQDLERQIKQSIETRTDLQDVSVKVKNCVARLTGTVPSPTLQLEAAVVARSTQGVCSVEDDLRLRSGDVPLRRSGDNTHMGD